MLVLTSACVDKVLSAGQSHRDAPSHLAGSLSRVTPTSIPALGLALATYTSHLSPPISHLPPPTLTHPRLKITIALTLVAYRTSQEDKGRGTAVKEGRRAATKVGRKPKLGRVN